MDNDALDEFRERISLANMNVNEILGYEPSAGKVLLYLSMVAALDCADAEDPEAAVASDLEIIPNVVELALRECGDKGIVPDLDLTIPELDRDERLDLFIDAQGFLEDLISAHMDEFGDGTEEGQILAYNEVVNSIIYMCSVVCARCKKKDVALDYIRNEIPSTYRFIKEECSLVPKESIGL